jgi:phosphoglycerate-specific signal transduction histidine kinase
MENESERNPEQGTAQAAEHITNAHQILQVLQDKIGQHPELAAAILKLEMALNLLTIETRGLL